MVNPMTQRTTAFDYPGTLGAAFSSFTFETPDGWSRIWTPGALGGVTAGPIDGLAASPFTPNAVVESARVGGSVSLDTAARDLFDSTVEDRPDLQLVDEVVAKLGDRTAVRRTQRFAIAEPQLEVEQILVFALGQLPGVPEQEFLQLTLSCDAIHAEALAPTFDAIIASFRFTGGTA
jgi:hypothetical protein